MIAVHKLEQMAQMCQQLPTLHLIPSGQDCLGPESWSKIKLEQASAPQRWSIMSRPRAPSGGRMSRREGKYGAKLELRWR